MELLTKVTLPEIPCKITHKEAILLLGSCFATNIGENLIKAKFNALSNPYGVLYNPASIGRVTERALSKRPYTESDLFMEGSLFHSYDHHSCFSSTDSRKMLRTMNAARKKTAAVLKSGSHTIITFGTAYVYCLKSDGRVVANCHKQPDRLFARSRMSIDEIVALWRPLMARIRKLNPAMKFIFTVSPIRHLKDGLHENQLSKATLLLAIEALKEETEGVFYFPSYEIMIDELRDYRFYAEDMVHPSPTAVKFIWEQFKNCLTDNDTRQAIDEWQALTRAIEHRPLTPESEQYKYFLSQTLLKIEEHTKKFPYFDTANETEQIKARLSRLP